jgi:hypothetical protein
MPTDSTVLLEKPQERDHFGDLGVKMEVKGKSKVASVLKHIKQNKNCILIKLLQGYIIPFIYSCMFRPAKGIIIMLLRSRSQYKRKICSILTLLSAFVVRAEIDSALMMETVCFSETFLHNPEEQHRHRSG